MAGPYQTPHACALARWGSMMDTQLGPTRCRAAGGGKPEDGEGGAELLITSASRRGDVASLCRPPNFNAFVVIKISK